MCESVVIGQTQTEKVFLSGKDNNSKVEWDFYCTKGRKSGEWTKIIVPSCWEQQGFGYYDYGRNYHTYGRQFEFSDEQGLYKHEFNVPESWIGKDIEIVFEGSMTDTEVKINGELAGEIHQGSFYQFRYNITDKLKYGENNLLEVKVSKMSANKMVNRAERYADYWIFGGIFRPVYLEVLPNSHIEHTTINAAANGEFDFYIKLKNAKKGQSVKAQILDNNGKEVSISIAKLNDDGSLIKLSGVVASPKLWTSETPNLYNAKIELIYKKEMLHSTTEKFGFRTIEVRKGEGIFINGSPVKMKGINRHAFWPETGRTLNADLDLMDVKLIKEMNMNSIRCSHYPPDKSFLNYCDSLGLYVIDELAGWQNAYDTEVGEKLVKEMVMRDINHPSVIFWSNGNEGGSNAELDDDFAKYDPTSRVLIRAHHKPGNAINGIDCNHYENYYSTKEIISGENVYMPTEFLHCQDDGGGAAGLKDYWDLMYNSANAGGGFLWVFSDEAIVRTDLNNLLDANKVNANDGVLGPHREKEGSFYAIREIYSPVKVDFSSVNDDFNGEIKVENQYFFTNLNKCKFELQLVNFPSPFNRDNGFEIVKKTGIQSPDVEPWKNGLLKLDLPSDWQQYDGIRLVVYDPFGKQVMEWSHKNKENVVLADINDISGKGSYIEVEETDEEIIVKAGGKTISFSKKDGRLISVNVDKAPSVSFNNGPLFVSGSSKVIKVDSSKSDIRFTVEVKYEGDLKYVRWTVKSNGWVQLDYEYSLNGDYPFAGISFDYPESNVIGAKWLGNGPYRVWKNRPYGGSLGVWENLYNDTQTGISPWIYPEFKGYFSDISWMILNTAEGNILIVPEDDDLYVRLFEFAGLSGKDIYPELPIGNLSFLDAIPPIGTKMSTGLTKDASMYGPQSEMNHINKTVKRTLHFYFGMVTE